VDSNEIWNQLCERHNWNDPETICKLRARGLKALLDQAYEEGRRDGSKDSADIMAKLSQNSKTKKDPLSKMFGGIFGDL